MELCKDDVRGVSPISANVMTGEGSRLSVQRRLASRRIRVRGIDCLLTDIQAQIGNLRRERTYLRLVREDVAGMKAKRRNA